MDTKDILYLILGGLTIAGNIVAVVSIFSWMKFNIGALTESHAKMMAILYPAGGQLQFQTTDNCKSCRKSCRDEICGFVKTEMAEHRESIRRIHERLDEISIWMPEKNKR